MWCSPGRARFEGSPPGLPVQTRVLESVGMAPFPSTPFAQVNIYGCFLLHVIGFPPSRSRPRLLELLNSEIGSLWVGDQSCLAGKPTPQSENTRAPEERTLKQLFTQTLEDFVSGIATAATFVCGWRHPGWLPVPSSSCLLCFPCKVSRCLGSVQ